MTELLPFVWQKTPPTKDRVNVGGLGDVSSIIARNQDFYGRHLQENPLDLWIKV